MELNTILKLLDAGYTKADIDAMTAPAAEVTPAEPVQESVKSAEETPAEKPEPEMTSDDILSNLLAEVKGLKAQIQANNIRSDRMNSGPVNADQTAEAILASIINPKKEG